MADATDNKEPETLSFKSSGKTEERVVLFTIDDEEFDVPKAPGMKVVMRYLNVARKTGNDLYAAQQLVEDMLGEEKWEKFLNWPDMSDEVMNTVLTKCIDIAVKSVEDTAKN